MKTLKILIAFFSVLHIYNWPWSKFLVGILLISN